MMRYVLAGLFLLVIGCSGTIPFHAAERVSLEGADPRAVLEQFQRRVPDNFQLLNSIVFEYNWFTFSGVGFVEISTKEGSYKVACMNQMGVKLIEFEGNRGGIVSWFAIEPLAAKGDVAAVVGADIQRIYLDAVPSTQARITKRKREFVFRERSGEGALEYVFAGSRGNLARKTYIEDHRAVWRVSYYEYQEKNGKVYPMGIIFNNYRYGYRLIVRQKEFRG